MTDKIISTTTAYLRTEVISKVNGYTALVRCCYSTDGEHFKCMGEFDGEQGKWVGAKHAIYVTGDSGAYADFADFTVE